MKILPTIIECFFNEDILIKNEICPLCTGELIESTYLTSQCGSCRTDDRPFSLGTSTDPCYCKDYREKCLKCPQCYDKIYLFVPFKQKDIAKELGCKWDSDKKRWYFKWSEWTTNPETKEKAYKLLKMFGSPRVQLLLEKIMFTHSKMFTLKPNIVRPNIRVQAKKNDFVEPAEAPGEGRRRPPNEEENKDSEKGVHPLKKFIMDNFKIKEIDYEKFNKENKWAIRPGQKKDKE